MASIRFEILLTDVKEPPQVDGLMTSTFKKKNNLEEKAARVD